MVPPPTQPQGLKPLEGFLSGDHSPCMVPWWFPLPTQPKGLNPLEGFISVDHVRLYGTLMVPAPNLKGWIPLKVFSMLIIPPVWYPDGSPATQPKGLNPLEGFISVDHIPLYDTLMFPAPNLKGWIPLKGLSVLIIPPVWYPDGSPPTQPKGLNPLEGFISVDLFRLYGTLMVPPPNLKGWIRLKVFSVLIIPPVWYPDGSPPQPKGLNPLEGFLSVDHFSCMVPWWFPAPNLKGWIPWRLSQCWSFFLYGTLMVPPPNLKGWIPLKVFSMLIIPPVWYPDVPPPT